MAVFDNSGSQGPRRKTSKTTRAKRAAGRVFKDAKNDLPSLSSIAKKLAGSTGPGVVARTLYRGGDTAIRNPREVARGLGRNAIAGAVGSVPGLAPVARPLANKALPVGRQGTRYPSNKTYDTERLAFSSGSSPRKAPPYKAPAKAAPRKAVAATNPGRASARGVQNTLPVVSGSSANAAPVKVTGGGGKPVVSGGAKTTSTTSSATSQLQSFLDKAKASVSAEDLPKLNALQRQLDSLNRSGEKDIRSTRNGVEAQKLAYEHLYGKLGEFQGGLKDAQAKNYEALEGKTNANYDQLLQSITGNYDAARQSTTSEAERLGLGSQVPVSTAGQVQDQSFLQGLAGVDKQHYSTQMAQSGSDFSQVMDMMRNNTARENVSAQRQAGTQGELAIQEIMNQLREGRFDIEGQQGDIRATQGQRARELAEGLEDKDYSRRQDTQQTEFSQWLARENLKMDKGKFDAEMKQLSAPPPPPSYEDQLDLALKQNRLDNALKPPGRKMTPEERYKSVLHGTLSNPKDPKTAARNMTDLNNIIQTLRTGNYEDHLDGDKDGTTKPGKFDENDRALLSHLDYALKRRFGNTDLRGPALDMIRALRGNL